MFFVAVPFLVGALIPPEAGVNMPRGDLPNMPVERGSAELCGQTCEANADCALYTWHAPVRARPSFSSAAIPSLIGSPSRPARTTAKRAR
jgi:hypothetical protein